MPMALAGSCGDLLESVRNLVAWGIPLEQAVYAAPRQYRNGLR